MDLLLCLVFSLHTSCSIFLGLEGPVVHSIDVFDKQPRLTQLAKFLSALLAELAPGHSLVFPLLVDIEYLLKFAGIDIHQACVFEESRGSAVLHEVEESLLFRSLVMKPHLLLVLLRDAAFFKVLPGPRLALNQLSVDVIDGSGDLREPDKALCTLNILQSLEADVAAAWQRISPQDSLHLEGGKNFLLASSRDIC